MKYVDVYKIEEKQILLPPLFTHQKIYAFA